MKPAHAAGPTRPDPIERSPPLSRRTLLRRTCLVAGAVPLAATIDGLAITPRRLMLSHHTFGHSASNDRLRIVQVSDLHVHGIGTLERQLLEQLHDAQADLIVITGDAIDRANSLPLLDTLLAEFPTAPRRLAIMGNWEYKSGAGLRSMEKTYERHGIELLVNRSVELEHRGRTIRVTGLDDILYSQPNAATALGDSRPLEPAGPPIEVASAAGEPSRFFFFLWGSPDPPDGEGADELPATADAAAAASEAPVGAAVHVRFVPVF